MNINSYIKYTGLTLGIVLGLSSGAGTSALALDEVTKLNDLGWPFGKKVTLTCESKDFKYRECGINGLIILASVSRQLSNQPCIRESFWGVAPTRNSIWVKDGCRAEFSLTYTELPF